MQIMVISAKITFAAIVIYYLIIYCILGYSGGVDNSFGEISSMNNQCLIDKHFKPYG